MIYAIMQPYMEGKVLAQRLDTLNISHASKVMLYKIVERIRQCASVVRSLQKKQVV